VLLDFAALLSAPPCPALPCPQPPTEDDLLAERARFLPGARREPIPQEDCSPHVSSLRAYSVFSAPFVPHGAVRPEIETLIRQGETEFLGALEPETLRSGPGGFLMRMGEEHEYLYVIEQGWLARTRTLKDGRRQIMVLFLSGDTCGLKTIFLRHQLDAVEALTRASARRIHYEKACALAQAHFGVALLFAWQLADDERHLHNWTLRLGRANAEERLAAFLADLRDRLGYRGIDTSSSFPLPITQQEIADHVGLTLVHVNRVLRRFRERGMVELRHGRAWFLDNAGALEELARPVRDVVGLMDDGTDAPDR
jgi:CRP/FNR family transcriptional regulator